jgi:hypothetical protein
MSIVYLFGKLMLALASRVIFGSQFRGTHDHILLNYDIESGAALTRLVSSLYCITSVFTAQKTQNSSILEGRVKRTLGQSWHVLLKRERVLVAVEACLPAVA